MTVHNIGYTSGSLLHEYGFTQTQIHRLKRQDIYMYKSAAKPTVKRRDKVLNLGQGDVHYVSNHGFDDEQLDPLPCTNVFQQRHTYPWRSYTTSDAVNIESDHIILPEEQVDIEPRYLDPATYNRDIKSSLTFPTCMGNLP